MQTIVKNVKKLKFFIVRMSYFQASAKFYSTDDFPFGSSGAGLPDYSWYNIPKQGKYTQFSPKSTKWPSNISNGRKIY
jgi:hypothetical protein